MIDIKQRLLCSGILEKPLLSQTLDMAQMAKVPPELMSKFQLIIYSDPIDAVFKALGVE